MKKVEHGDYVKAAESYPDESKGPQVGTLRIAKVSYDYHPLHQSTNGVSIGTMIDEHISKTIAAGNLINEISLFFETQDQQEAVANLYSEVTKFHVSAINKDRY